MSGYGRTNLTLILILILVSAIVGTAGAALTVTVTSSPGTLVANGHDNATIRVLVMDGGTPVSNQSVDISIHNPLLGTLTPAIITTGPLGYAESQFSVGTTPGTAIITAIVANATPSAIAIPLIAPVADSIILSTDKTWVVANGQDQAIVTATLTNTSYGETIPVVNQNVMFTLVEGAVMGSLSRGVGVTNSSGMTTTVYTTATKSGSATIGGSSGPVSTTIKQLVDHDLPFSMSTHHEPEVTVGNLTTLSVHLQDQWGNPIDIWKDRESVQFIVSSPGDTARFSDGYGSWSNNLNLSVDSQGNISAHLRVSTQPGWNNIQIIPPAPVPAKGLSILAISNGIPTSMQTIVDPSTEWQYADGTSKITITYILRDQYDNPIENSGIHIVPSEGDPLTVYTDALGKMSIDVNPQTIVKNITVVATAVDNSSVTSTKNVQFVPTEPVDMGLTVSPLILPSGEVPLENGEVSYAEIRAKVVDAKGNGVSGQAVSFSISDIIGIDASVNDPYLETTSAVSNENGYAIVRFRPGTFEVYGEPHFTKKASASCNVRAQWSSVQRSQKIEWKNYPILYAETSSYPPQVYVGNYTYITLKLKGDGFAIVPDPIDVVLCTDRSGSMLYDNPDRMYSVREAGKAFVNEMSSTRDQVGIVTFGRKGSISRPGYNSGISTSEINNVYIYPRSYADYATIDKSLTNNFADVRNEMDKILPDHGTPMRYAVYKSVKDIVANGRGNSVRAIIVLSDGDYNWYGDPLGRGYGSTTTDPTSYGDLTTNYRKFTDISQQNLTNYAKDNDIKIFSIGYASQISSGGRNTLRVLAEGTGGRYYDGNAANINQIYEDIAGELQTEAGADITIAMDFGTITVDGTAVDNTGNQVLEYQYAPNPPYESTKTIRYFSGNTTQINYPISDDRTMWNLHHTLSFTVGKINLGDYWQTQFRLKVNKNGVVDIFGPNSGVDYTLDGVAQPRLELPKITVYGNPNLQGGISTCGAEITQIKYTPEAGANAAPFVLPRGTKSVSASWNLNSTCGGNITEIIEYRLVDRDTGWNTMITQPVDSYGTHNAVLDLSDVRPGEVVSFRLKIKVPEGTSLSGYQPDSEIRSYVIQPPKPAIRLE
jgi:Mg-chelatase subunit ChlD